MPRKGRGGSRNGTPGRAYSNRSDLNQNRTLPIKAAPGQQYGQRKAQEDAQRAVPMAGGPPVAQGPPQGLPEGVPAPGSMGPLDAPSERPGEPITAGAALGAGPGSAALGPDPAEMARQEDLRALAPYLPVLEYMANRPGSPATTRNMVRRLKGAS